MLLLFLVAFISHVVHCTGSSYSVNQCNPANHICEGQCPDLPAGAQLPHGESQMGLCLKDSRTEACVCWLRSHPAELHLQTLFKCTAIVNDTVKDIMCLPPPVCFPPDVDPGCLIIPHCPCVHHIRGSTYGRWLSVVAVIIRSGVGVVTNVPTQPSNEQAPPAEKPQADVREFSLKHLLFLLAFVIAPLLCWCLLTFFHEGKCRRKQSTPETEPMSTDRSQEVPEEEPRPGSCAPVLQPPTAPPKFESPPPYREAADLGESCLLAGDCGPPPSYEDAVRDVLCHRLPEPDSE